MLMRTYCWIALLPLVAAVVACEDFGGAEGEKGELRWTLEKSTDLFTKASSEMPDTNDFLLTISDAGGRVLYDGTYGASPQSLPVQEGSYLVYVRCCDFLTPAFDSAQYGDQQLVVVRAGESVTVRLLCTMMNAGVRLRRGSDFLAAYPEGVVYLKSDKGRLMYAYREDRIAYFHPGAVSVTLFNEGKEETLLTRTLLSQQILTLSLRASSPQSGHSGIEVAVDTTRNWTSEDYLIGGNGNQGSEPSDACSVADWGKAGLVLWIYRGRRPDRRREIGQDIRNHQRDTPRPGSPLFGDGKGSVPRRRTAQGGGAGRAQPRLPPRLHRPAGLCPRRGRRLLLWHHRPQKHVGISTKVVVYF